jgi:hypothetical protein
MNDDINIGNLAEMVVTNTAYKKAFSDMKSEILERFQKTRYNEQSKRDAIWRELKAMEQLEDKLNEYMVNGRIAKQSLIDKAKNILR